LPKFVPQVSAGIVAALLLAACGTGGEAATGVPSSSTSTTMPTTPPASASPSLQPALSQEPVPSGWERVEIAEEGFAISLPQGWEVADLASGDIDEMVDLLDDDPQLQPFADQLPDLMASGIALWAIALDADSLENGFATNLNALVEDDVPMSLDAYAAANVSFVENTLSVDVQREALELPAGDAVRLTYEPTIEAVGTYHVTQYLVMDGDQALIATFSRANTPELEGLETEFLDIIETLEFLP
jgi:hypothetical protein